VATVRPAVLEDLSLIVDFQLRMASETEEVELDEAVLSEGVRAVLLDPLKGEYYIAMLDEEPVGCLLTVREWSDWRNGEVVWIHSLYVTLEARRRGVFKQLYVYLRHMIEGDTNLKGLRLYVHRDNVQAQNAYKALGMDGDHYRLFEWMPED
jgi:GNAT superfamily N-acetyltransferase